MRDVWMPDIPIAVDFTQLAALFCVELAGWYVHILCLNLQLLTFVIDCEIKFL